MNTTPQTIYLAGGMKSGWQHEVSNQLSESNDFSFLDPRHHRFDRPNRYTAWDRYSIDQCDILFGYMEEENPSGYPLAAEIGYAKGQGKLVIFVNEKEHRYWHFIEEMADITSRSIEEGIEILRRFGAGQREGLFSRMNFQLGLG